MDFAQDNVLNRMYQDYFMEYASYVILDRAVPYYEDGLKPVQRRILHTLWEKNDGRYHKVANLIGHTMQYHPHGDAAIGDAMVNMGQKGLLIDAQGNWGNPVTGDGSAAPRYIEARLTPFALDVLFNPETTNWVPSYDGRNDEPVSLPVKFPLLLSQGVEGIAVGLSTKILPHNFCELIEASIAHIKGRGFKLVPDFITGGKIDATNYKNGERGGKIKVRAKIENPDKKTLVITEIPYGTTTSGLIDSIVNANEKGKIKIKKIEDNTAENVEIVVHLSPNTDPLLMTNALFAFTDCESSISPNCCVIVNKKPVFSNVKDVLIQSTEHTVELLKWELTNRQADLERKWHNTSLEKIFIENKIYRRIEQAGDREEMIAFVEKGLKPHTKHLRQEITRDDILRLTEIPIRRISRFDAERTKDLLKEIDQQLKEVRYHLKYLSDYAVDYFKNLLKKYGKLWPRKTIIETFESVSAAKVSVVSKKLFLNRKEGFIGTSLKKEEFAFECSPLDDIIVFKKDCSVQVSKVSDKTFVGKNIIHIEVFDKNDKRRVYNYVYEDGEDQKVYVKRFNMGGVTRDKKYDLAKGSSKAKVLFLSSNPNGESEILDVVLKPRPRIKLNFKNDLATIPVKNRTVKGNLLSKHPVKKVKSVAQGESTLGAQKLYFNPASGEIISKVSEVELGNFGPKDFVLVVRKNGAFTLATPKDGMLIPADYLRVEKLDHGSPYSMIYFDGGNLAHYGKKLNLNSFDANKEHQLIADPKDSSLLWFGKEDQIAMEFQGISGKSFKKEVLHKDDLALVKSLKALGTRLARVKKMKRIVALEAGQESQYEVILKKTSSLKEY
jgi:topoisomerase-4 subunit A